MADENEAVNTDKTESENPEVLVLDGSILEGGGQVLRQSVGLAMLLEQPIRIVKIRGKRPKPGMAQQHLVGITLANELSDGRLIGAEIRSEEITFYPGAGCKERVHTADIQTAGSICLVVQVSLPGLLFHRAGPCEVTIKGGTNATHAPQTDYAIEVLLPTLKKHFGLQASLEVRRRGFFPRGGGEVVLKTTPVKGPIPAFTLMDRGKLVSIRGVCLVAGRLPAHITQHMVAAARAQLAAAFHVQETGVTLEVEARHEPNSFSTGVAVWLIATTSTGCILAGSSLGEKRQRGEEVAKVACDDLIQQWSQGGCVDCYLQDQLIIYMALAQGKSRMRAGPLTLHTRTAIHFASLVTGGRAKFNVLIDQGEGTTVVECEGIGFHR